MAQQRIPLAQEDVRALMLFIDTRARLQAQLDVTTQLEAQYLARLREQYGLGEGWECFDILDGFVRTIAPEGGTHADNHIGR